MYLSETYHEHPNPTTMRRPQKKVFARPSLRTAAASGRRCQNEQGHTIPLSMLFVLGIVFVHEKQGNGAQRYPDD